MAWYRCGGGGSEGKKTPQMIDSDSDFSVTQKASYTTSHAFTLKKGDTLLVGITHRSATITVSNDLTPIISATAFGNFYFSVYKKVATQDETIQPTITNPSTNFLGSAWLQLRDADVKVNDTIVRSTASSYQETVPTPLTPFVFFCFFSTNSPIRLASEQDFVFRNGNAVNTRIAFAVNINTNTAQSAVVNFGTSGTNQHAVAILDI